MKIRVSLIAILAVSAFAVVNCSDSPPGGVLVDFEHDEDLDKMLWRCPVLFELTEGIAPGSEHALRAKLQPAEYPGVEFEGLPRDWSGYDALEFTLQADDVAGETLHIRIDDKPQIEEFENRYQGYRKIAPGVQTIRIPLAEIKEGPRHRAMNMSEIFRVIFYLHDQKQPFEMRLDDVRLVRE
ncbi:MAG: hypothetical protein H6684_16550 [Deltaproteobacteria bacterium]|nr:hypothetical protein [Deltaproteobacteria bacterium]